ncbi:MAG: winged helix-turn-helix domain-containing protein [Prevotella sp.]|jgi:hypothetical protein|nr:winged helix-turn-helix domain-containing protein [Prevotella sp.]MCI1281147.1 winged helix-turn-helix domain-containing protein [Prevotella sp.]
MDKRIKIVWYLSILTMVLIFFGQAYWLYTQYEYSGDEIALQVEKDCSAAICEEGNIRYNGYKNSMKGKKELMTWRIESKFERSETQITKTHTTLTYTFPNHKKIKIYDKNLDDNDGAIIYDRYNISAYKPFQQAILDSLLTAKGYGKTLYFAKKERMELKMEPQYQTTGGLRKMVKVSYCSNPMMGKGIAFEIPIPVSSIIQSMAWQLILSLLLLSILAFCLLYQVKTILIQMRIDALRHAFMKNMIYEMKQPQDSEGIAVSIGETEFYYEQNELRHGNERVIITSRQAEILRMLSEKMNTMVERTTLLNEIWGDDSYANSLALNVQITYLRRALNSDPTVSIETVIKKGYRLKA